MRKQRSFMIYSGILVCIFLFSVATMLIRGNVLAADEIQGSDTVAPVIDFYEDTIVIPENASLFRITAYDLYEKQDVAVEYIWPEGTVLGEKGLPGIGSYELILRSTDHSGNQAEKRVTVTVTERDTIAPVIAVKSDKLRTMAGTKPLLHVKATDNSGVEPTVVGVWSEGALDAAGKLREGVHKYTITATDAEKNSAVKVIEVTVTKTPVWTEPIVDEETNDNTTGQESKTVTVKAQYNKDGYQETVCSVCNQPVESRKTICAPKTVTVSTLQYNGKKQTAKVVVKDRKGNIIPASDYKVKGNQQKKVGSYTVTVTFKASSVYYAGKLTGKGTVLPKTLSLTKLLPDKNGFSAEWKRQTKEVTGYQIRYSVNKNMSKAKTVTVKKAKSTSLKVTKLKGNKKYYVQIRSYKKVSGSTYYSSWSRTKTVMTKK